MHKVDTVVGGELIIPATPDVIPSFVAEAEAAPEELSTIANITTAPPMPFLSPEMYGRPVMIATLVHAGGVDEGERAVAPFRALAEPIADMVGPIRYPELYPPDESNHQVASARTMFVDAIERDAAEAIISGPRPRRQPRRRSAAPPGAKNEPTPFGSPGTPRSLVATGS